MSQWFSSGFNKIEKIKYDGGKFRRKWEEEELKATFLHRQAEKPGGFSKGDLMSKKILWVFSMGDIAALGYDDDDDNNAAEIKMLIM